MRQQQGLLVFEQPPVCLVLLLIDAVLWLEHGALQSCTAGRMSGLHSKSLLDLNPTSAKFLVWTVRVLHGRILHYEFKDRNKKLVKATKFDCVLLSLNPQDYIMATFRHNYRDPDQVAGAKDLYRDGTVWRLSGVHLTDGAMFSGAPNKYVVLLERSGLVRVRADTPEYSAPAQAVLPALRLLDVLQVRQSRTVDACLFVASCADPHKHCVHGVDRDVVMARVTDASHSAEVRCWGSSAKTMQGFAGKPVVVLGISATISEKGVTLNLLDGAVIVAVAAPAQAELEVVLRPSQGVVPIHNVVSGLWAPQVGVDSIYPYSSFMLGCAAIVGVVLCCLLTIALQEMGLSL